MLMVVDNDDDHEAGEAELEELNEKPQDLSEVNRKVQNVVWSPDGNMFAILYRRMLEVFDLKEEGGKPTFRTVLDYPTNTITWLNESTIIMGRQVAESLAKTQQQNALMEQMLKIKYVDQLHYKRMKRR